MDRPVETKTGRVMVEFNRGGKLYTYLAKVPVAVGDEVYVAGSNGIPTVVELTASYKGECKSIMEIATYVEDK